MSQQLSQAEKNAAKFAKNPVACGIKWKDETYYSSEYDFDDFYIRVPEVLTAYLGACRNSPYHDVSCTIELYFNSNIHKGWSFTCEQLGLRNIELGDENMLPVAAAEAAFNRCKKDAIKVFKCFVAFIE